MRVALTGLTIAEYFRDVEGQDVLLYRQYLPFHCWFRHALLGRMSSAVGNQHLLRKWVN